MNDRIHPIPNAYRLRRRQWQVLREPSHPRNYAGLTLEGSKRINLYDKAHDRKRTPNEQQRTFWHELTHSILFTMNHPLATNEAFVTAFSLLLEEAVRTARFEGETP